MKKNLLGMIFMLIAVVGAMVALTVTANAYEANNGVLRYNIYDNKVTITGCDTSVSGSLTIPDVLDGYPVTGIGDRAFWCHSSLTSVIIPDGVTRIGYSAFEYCSSLTEITIPDSVTNIGSDAISRTAWYNNQLDGVVYAGKVVYKYKGIMPEGTAITIPDGITSIVSSAFENCSSLTKITIPDSVNYIGEAVFYGCSKLTELQIPFTGASKTESGEGRKFGYIFGDKSYNESYVVNQGDKRYYYLPKTLKKVTVTNENVIAYRAFSDCTNICEIDVKEGATAIKDYAFSGCTSLKKVYIPSTVETIAQQAFSDCSGLTSIIIPDSVTSIGEYTFSNCKSLTSVTMPDGITSIGASAFVNCSSLAKITIPDSVNEIGAAVFDGCSKLTELQIPFTGSKKTASDEERTFGYIFGGSSFDGSYVVKQRYASNNTKTYYLPKTLKKVTVTNEDAIAYGAFNNCTNIYEIDVKEGATAIENYAFSGCDLLKRVYIPSSVEIIAQQTFSDSGNVTLYGDGSSYVAAFAAKNKIPFVKTGSGTQDNVTIVTEDTVGDLTWRLYSNGLFELSGSGHMPNFRNSTKTPWYAYLDIIKKVEISADTVIGSYSFFGMENLESVSISGNVTEIADDAFSNCTSLEKITIPSSVTAIGEYAFDECPKLTIYCKTGSAAEAYAKEHGIALRTNDFDAVINQYGSQIIVTAKIPDDDTQKVIHAALYASDGRLLDYMLYPAEFANNTVHFTFRKQQDSAYLKVFLWGSIETVVPLEDSIVLNIK